MNVEDRTRRSPPSQYCTLRVYRGYVPNPPFAWLQAQLYADALAGKPICCGLCSAYVEGVAPGVISTEAVGEGDLGEGAGVLCAACARLPDPVIAARIARRLLEQYGVHVLDAARLGDGGRA